MMTTIRHLADQIALVLILTGVLVLTTMSLPQAGTYVSWKGGFYIEYPDEWQQIDYGTADQFLRLNRAGRLVMDYEAVFADNAVKPFFRGPYFMLTADTATVFGQEQIDSSLYVLRKLFGKDIAYFPVANFLSDLVSNTPTYDRETKIASVYSDIVQAEGLVKKSLLMVRFYDRGAASFYFYAPDSLFPEGAERMQEVVASFSTEGLDSVAQSSEVKVADVDPHDSSPVEGIDRSVLIALSGLGVSVLILVIVMARKKKKNR